MNNSLNNPPKSPPLLRRIRSFVRREGRLTPGQEKATAELLPVLGLTRAMGVCQWAECFKREAPRILEIGFGMGHSLLAMAKAHPEQDFIGIETHLPGIGRLLLGIKVESLSNIRVFHDDAVEILTHCIPDNSLDTVQIFFPDPWPKRKHHKRRLIQPEFIEKIAQKIKAGGTLHIATDWADYASHILKVLTAGTAFKNASSTNTYSERSEQRPVITKFEARGQKWGHPIWDLKFIRLQ